MQCILWLVCFKPLTSGNARYKSQIGINCFQNVHLLLQNLHELLHSNLYFFLQLESLGYCCLLCECVVLDRDRVNPVVMPKLCSVDVRAHCKMCLYKCYFADGYDTENVVVPEWNITSLLPFLHSKWTTDLHLPFHLQSLTTYYDITQEITALI